MTDLPAYMAEAGEAFKARAIAYGGEPEVTQTLIGVSALVQDRLKIEIKCVVHL